MKIKTTRDDIFRESSQKEVWELMGFMIGSDGPVLRRLIVFFSKKTGNLEPKYLHPRELREFWASLDQYERSYYWNLYRIGGI